MFYFIVIWLMLGLVSSYLLYRYLIKKYKEVTVKDCAVLLMLVPMGFIGIIVLIFNLIDEYGDKVIIKK